MPRPTKVFSRQRVSAALAWKRGEKQEAYKLWEGAAKGLKEHYAKKHNKKKRAADEVATAAAEAEAKEKAKAEAEAAKANEAKAEEAAKSE